MKHMTHIQKRTVFFSFNQFIIKRKNSISCSYKFSYKCLAESKFGYKIWIQNLDTKISRTICITKWFFYCSISFSLRYASRSRKVLDWILLLNQNQISSRACTMCIAPHTTQTVLKNLTGALFVRRMVYLKNFKNVKMFSHKPCTIVSIL